MKIREAARFVTYVWNHAAKRGWASIQHKQGTSGLHTQWFKVPVTSALIGQYLSVIPEGSDIYFCPTPGNKKSRKKSAFTNLNLLWADLDEVNPDKLSLRPTIAWETSPKRFQALWVLEDKLDAKQVERINRNLTYQIGADKGGWDLGQILRVPFTTNYKPKYAEPDIKLLWMDGPQLETSNALRLLKKSKTKQTPRSSVNPPVTLSKTLRDQWIHWKSIPEGERSEKPHAWAWGLLSRGVDPLWVVRAVSEHPLTVKKYGERAIAEVERSVEKWRDTKPSHHITTEWNAPTVLNVTDFLATRREVRWMIKSTWMDEIVGVIVGPPKSFKTWVVFDLAVSVASHTPFMGFPEFTWNESRLGRNNVLIIQEEDPQPVMASRLSRIFTARGFDAGGFKRSRAAVKKGGESLTLESSNPIPLFIVNASGFNLQEQNYLEWLEEQIAILEPRLVILDPLLVMLGDVDEYKGGEVSRLLRPIKLLRDRYGCAFIIVHHASGKKVFDPKTTSRGATLYGSFAFHAWLESAIYINPIGDVLKTRTVSIDKEFKSAPAGNPFEIYFPPMDKTYTPEIHSVEEGRAKRREQKKSTQDKENVDLIYTAVKKEPKHISEIMEDLNWSRTRTRQAINLGISQGLLRHTGALKARGTKIAISE